MKIIWDKDIAEQNFQQYGVRFSDVISILNQALKASLPQLFSLEDTLQVKDLERFTFRLQHLIQKGKTYLGYLSEYDVIPTTATEAEKKELEQKKRHYFYRAMALLVTVNNLLDIFFQNQDLLYLQSLKKLSGQMTVGTSVNKMTQIICILEELYFDVEQHVFNLDILHS